MVVNPAFARPPLAEGRVRFVGDIVAVVAAETRAAAVDAAELVIVDYDPLPAVVDPEAATGPDAPLQFEAVGTNVAAGSREAGDDDPLAGADVVVRGRFENQRMAVVPMEGNAIAVVPGDDGAGHDLTVYVATQMPHGWRNQAVDMFGLDPARLRVVAPHVGGAFGGKAAVAAEHAVAVAVALRLGRPVKWVESRSENLVAMPHGRGQVQYVELGLRHDGTIVGLRCRVIGDAGAYAGFGGGLAGWTTKLMAQGPYRIPRIGYDVATVVTNTTPMGAFRGAGRPEATAFLERILDMAADELGLDPAEIRRRNFLAADGFPHRTVMGATYDSGDYDAALDRGPPPGRLRRPAGRAGRTAPAGRPAAPRHRAVGLRGGHRRRQRHRVGVGRGPRRRHRDGQGRHLGPRPGPRHLLRHAGRRPPRRAARGGAVRAVRHRRRPHRGRNRRVPFAAVRAAAPWPAPPTPWWPPDGPWPPSSWRPARATSSCPTTGGSAWPGYRPGPCRGPTSPSPARSRARR